MGILDIYFGNEQNCLGKEQNSRAQPSWASQSDVPQEKYYCLISPSPLKKEK